MFLACLLQTETPEEVQPGEAPPTADDGTQTETDGQTPPTEEAATTGQAAKPAANDAGEL